MFRRLDVPGGTNTADGVRNRRKARFQKRTCFYQRPRGRKDGNQESVRRGIGKVGGTNSSALRKNNFHPLIPENCKEETIKRKNPISVLLWKGACYGSRRDKQMQKKTINANGEKGKRTAQSLSPQKREKVNKTIKDAKPMAFFCQQSGKGCK